MRICGRRPALAWFRPPAAERSTPPYSRARFDTLVHDNRAR